MSRYHREKTAHIWPQPLINLTKTAKTRQGNSAMEWQVGQGLSRASTAFKNLLLRSASFDDDSQSQATLVLPILVILCAPS